jgi:hypothetical protein
LIVNVLEAVLTCRCPGWVTRVRLVDEFVGPELVPAGVSMVSGEYLEGNIVVLPSPLCYLTQTSAAQMRQTYWRFRASQTVEVDPKPNFPTTWYVLDAKVSPMRTGDPRRSNRDKSKKLKPVICPPECDAAQRL